MKTLIISHNPLSTKSSIGKTLLSLFFQFKKEELCQLYIHTGLPEGDVCNSYYRVTDKNILKGVFTRKVRGGEVSPVTVSIGSDESDRFYNSNYINKNKRKPYLELARDYMWALSPWYNSSLKKWVEKESPSCIFVAIGSSKFLYDIALKISKEYNLPIFTYVCDDFYSMKKPNEVFGGLWKRSLEKKTRALMAGSKGVVSICNEISELYEKEFSIPAITVMTGTNFEVSGDIRVKDERKVISYFGKVSLNRYRSLADIGRVLDEINAERGSDYSVDIFCGDIDDEVKDEFKTIRSCNFCGFLSGDKFRERFFVSDALLHVEAFDEASKDRVKNSVSTKIADSLSSGIPLFAYGPMGIASIEHLRRNGCGIVATDKNELKDKLLALFTDDMLVKASTKNNIDTAKKYHDPRSVSKSVYKLLY